jgi:hypothetical protein
MSAKKQSSSRTMMDNMENDDTSSRHSSIDSRSNSGRPSTTLLPLPSGQGTLLPEDQQHNENKAFDLMDEAPRRRNSFDQSESTSTQQVVKKIKKSLLPLPPVSSIPITELGN